VPRPASWIGCLQFAADLRAELWVYRGLGLRLAGEGPDFLRLKGELGYLWVLRDPDGHSPTDAFPVLYAPEFDQALDGFESQGGRRLDTVMAAGQTFHLLLDPDGHRLALTPTRPES
jgi:catechol 2,3-dioxygenase-like lactoylglutathione lyase family enzyme